MKNPKPPILLNIPKLSREEIEQVIEASENVLLDRIQEEKEHALQQIINYVIRNKITYTEIYENLEKANALYTKHTVAYVNKLYIDPDDSFNYWDGIGRRPNWLRKKLSEGYKLEDFLVKNQGRTKKLDYQYNPEDPSQKWNGIGRPPKWKTNLDKKNKG